jgi:hypothetical protein
MTAFARVGSILSQIRTYSCQMGRTLRLNNGLEIPIVGLGTYKVSPSFGELPEMKRNSSPLLAKSNKP